MLNFSKENDEICNEHVGNISGYASFYHECCHYDHHESMKCDRVLKNKWMQAIQYCTYIVIIIVVLYCPLLVPSSLYNPNYGPKKFEHCLEDSISLIVKTAESKTSIIRERICKQKDNGTTIVPYAKFKGMANFKKELKRMEKGHKYEVVVSKIYFRVRDEELLAANEVPTSVFKVLYDLLFKCNIRKQEFVSTCCKASICGTHWPHGITYPWYKLLRFLIRLILSVAVCIPWIIRVYFFYAYENEIRESRLKAAESRSLLVRIENNLTYYGTPVHVLFIICYALMCFGYIFLELTSVVLFKNIQCVVRDILTKCFDGMCDRSKQEVFQNCIKFLLKPCKAFGIFGMLLSIPYWICMVPLVFALNAYYFFPAVYIIFNFLCLFPHAFRRCICRSNIHEKKQVSSADEKKSIWSNLPFNTTKTYSNIEIGLMFILLCLMLSSLLLTVELVIFLIRVAIYTMVGVILNSSHAMQYISTISLAWLYYRRCFGGISQIYKAYNKAVHKILYRVNKRKLVEIAKKETKNQEHTAFKVSVDGQRKVCVDDVVKDKTNTKKNSYSKCCYHVDDREIKNKIIDTSDGAPKLKINGIILFLDRFDKQYITKKFFFKVCKINPEGPGPLSKHFGTALRRFGMIFIFLVFVTLVVLAFGDSYSLTFSNQLLATLAGGVVPWILMKFNILFTAADHTDADELEERYFSDEKNEMFNETAIENDQEQHKVYELNDDSEVSVKGAFKKKLNEKIREDEKWWTIADMVVTYKPIDLLKNDKSDLVVGI